MLDSLTSKCASILILIVARGRISVWRFARWTFLLMVGEDHAGVFWQIQDDWISCSSRAREQNKQIRKGENAKIISLAAVRCWANRHERLKETTLIEHLSWLTTKTATRGTEREALASRTARDRYLLERNATNGTYRHTHTRRRRADTSVCPPASEMNRKYD